MNSMVSIVMFGWIPAVLVLFLYLPPRRAVIAAFLVAWLFLPLAGFKFGEAIPRYDKTSATCVGVLLGMVVFDLRRLQTFRLSWIDLPMLIWCLGRLGSSLSVDLGFYDGIVSVFYHVLMWVVPYFIGRLYFQTRDDLRELALGMVIGGLIYVPLCLFEIRMSPQLYTWVYGFHPIDFRQVIRWGGFRPTVFMQHGLAVGLWMATTTLVAFWFALTGVVKRLGTVPMWGWFIALLATTILCKSTGAIALLGLGMATVAGVHFMRSPWPLVLLVALTPAYLTLRIGGLWDGTNAVGWISGNVGGDRAGSLSTRFEQEDDQIQVALKRPWLGWGGWQQGQDQLWLIEFRNNGFVALVSMVGAFSIPAMLCCPRSRWRGMSVGTSAAVPLAIIGLLFLLDCLFNGMMNPVFTLAMGGLGSVLMVRKSAGRKVVNPPRPPRVSQRALAS